LAAGPGVGPWLIWFDHQAEEAAASLAMKKLDLRALERARDES
jgi:hypothetical protein